MSDAEALVAAVERLSFGLVAVTALAVERATDGNALTFQQWRVMVIVGDRTTGVRIGTIAARLGASGPSASRIVRRLTARGLVGVDRDPTDGRAVLVRLTESGRGLRAEVIERRRRMIRESLVPIGPGADPATTLSRVADALERWV